MIEEKRGARTGSNYLNGTLYDDKLSKEKFGLFSLRITKVKLSHNCSCDTDLIQIFLISWSCFLNCNKEIKSINTPITNIVLKKKMYYTPLHHQVSLFIFYEILLCVYINNYYPSFLISGSVIF